MERPSKVALIACAGIDKPVGIVAQAAALEVAHVQRPENVELVVIPPLIAGVKPYGDLVGQLPVIVVDGCSERCALKIAAKHGGKIRARVLVSQLQQQSHLSPGSVLELGSEGEQLVAQVVKELCAAVDATKGA